MKRIATATALICLLAFAPLARATNDPVGGGSTKLVLDKSFVSFLGKDGVKLTAKNGAKRKGSSLTLPVSGGSLDPTTGNGQLDQEGTLTFEADGKKVPLRAITIKTKHSPLIAKVGGGQLKIATSQKISSKREGFGSAFTAKTLKLTAKVATRLNKKLRPKVPFAEGQALGSLVSKSQPQLITVIEQNKATLVFDAGFVAKLDAAFVSLNPIYPAEHLGATFTFPIIAGGSLAPNGSEGTLRTGGTVELLQLHGGQVFWKEPWLDMAARSDSAEVDLEPTPALPGKLGRVGIFDLGASAVASDPAARTISVSGAPLSLNAQAAGDLNRAFGEGKAVFAAGEALGTLSFAAVGQ